MNLVLQVGVNSALIKTNPACIGDFINIIRKRFQGVGGVNSLLYNVHQRRSSDNCLLLKTSINGTEFHIIFSL
jgi:hypothetical protein